MGDGKQLGPDAWLDEVPNAALLGFSTPLMIPLLSHILWRKIFRASHLRQS